jgi:hypothetical protein
MALGSFLFLKEQIKGIIINKGEEKGSVRGSVHWG